LHHPEADGSQEKYGSGREHITALHARCLLRRRYRPVAAIAFLRFRLLRPGLRAIGAFLSAIPGLRAEKQ
jgi:hypothetical protein